MSNYYLNDELRAAETVERALRDLSETGRARVIAWVTEVIEEKQWEASAAKRAVADASPVPAPAPVAVPTDDEPAFLRAVP